MPELIYEIAHTGGPGGGKSTALAIERERFSPLGFHVMYVTEAASFLLNNYALDINELLRDRRTFLDFQDLLLAHQIQFREDARRAARLVPAKKVLLLADRTPFCNRAYMTEPEYLQLLKNHNLSREAIGSWYDGAVFLRTAAKGAENFYTTANNAARTEDLAAARLLDDLTEEAYLSFPKPLQFISNDWDFEGKMQATVRAISHMVGLPVPTEIQYRFVLGSEFDRTRPELAKSPPVQIEDIYLMSPPGHETRIRKRTQDGESSYYQTWKQDTASSGVRIHRERVIKAAEYRDLQNLRDPSRAAVRKERLAFVFEDQYYWIDRILAPEPVTLLEVEMTAQNAKLHLPPWLPHARDVTHDRRYRNSEIAAHGVPGKGSGGISLAG